MMLLTVVFVAPAIAQQVEKNAAQYYVDGVNFFTQSRMRNAERAFLMALRESPADKAAWMGLMDVYTAQQRYDEGADAADKALAHHPGDPEFWIRKGAFLRDAGRLVEARDALERAVEVSGSDQDVVKRVKNNLYFDRDASGRIKLGAGK
jgi:Flp pilus assembly protein TadD